MNLKLGLIVTTAVLLSACAKFKSNDARVGGTIFSKAQAITVLTRAAQWCQAAVEMKDGQFATQKFIADGTGVYGSFSTITGKYESLEAMTWDVTNDVLTVTLPETHTPHVLAYKMRFS